jgi:hypothetical protein
VEVLALRNEDVIIRIVLPHNNRLQLTCHVLALLFFARGELAPRS